jgi:hypothetical protein
VAHRKVAKDFSKGLLCLANYYQEEVQVQGNKPTTVPTYTGVMLHAHKKKPKVMEFFFYNHDIEHYVKGTR